MAQHGQKERVCHLHAQRRTVGNHQTQGSVFAAAQVLGASVHGVLMRLGQGHDALARFWPDGFTAIQGTRNRGRGDTCQFGDV